jgi:hypothetical protein
MLIDFTLNNYNVLYDCLDTRHELLVPVRLGHPPFADLRSAVRGYLDFAPQAWIHDGSALLQHRGHSYLESSTSFLIMSNHCS